MSINNYTAHIHTNTPITPSYIYTKINKVNTKKYTYMENFAYKVFWDFYFLSSSIIKDNSINE